MVSTYNGHTYIAAFDAIAVAICFGVLITDFNILRLPVVVAQRTTLDRYVMLAMYLGGQNFYRFGIRTIGRMVCCPEPKLPNLFLLIFLLAFRHLAVQSFSRGFAVGLGLKMLSNST
jgi:hypothetical protein